MHTPHVTTEYPRTSWILIRNYRKRDDKNSTAATVAFSCTMKALSLTQSHSLFISFFVSLLARLRENGWTNLHEIFREGAEWPWDDALITFLVNSEKPRDAAMCNTGTGFVVLSHLSLFQEFLWVEPGNQHEHLWVFVAGVLPFHSSDSVEALTT